MTGTSAGFNRPRDLVVVAISDSYYLSRCATMIESAGVARFTSVLALDEGAKFLLSQFPDLETVDFNSFLAELGGAEKLAGRTRSEQIFSVGPSFLLRESKSVDDEGWLIYADSDLYFFEPLRAYLEELPPCNVVIAPHRHYPWNMRRLSKYGTYNVGLVAFRKNEEGLRALRFWAQSCIQWCLDRPEDGKYADQKYLEQFPSVSTGVFVDNSFGVNLAPWNAALKTVSTAKSGEIMVNGDKLIYFHAQGIRKIKGRWQLGHLNYLSLAGPQLKNIVYKPYLRKLDEWAQKPGFAAFGTSRVATTLLGKLTSSVLYFFSLLSGQTIRVNTNNMERVNDPPK